MFDSPEILASPIGFDHSEGVASVASIPNGVPHPPARKPRPKQKAKPAATSPAGFDTATTTELPQLPKEGRRRPPKDHYGEWFAHAGVGVTLVLSAWLNVLAFGRHGAAGYQSLILGVTLPLMILIFSRAGAWAYQGGLGWIAWIAAAGVLGMLMLSVKHVSDSISVISGESRLFSMLMGGAIDTGLISCELMLCLRKK